MSSRLSPLLALALAACCAAPPPDGSSTDPASLDPAATSAVDPTASSEPEPTVELARDRGAYKAQALTRFNSLQQRIQKAEALLGAHPDEARAQALRDANWELVRAHHAVESSGEDDFSEARARFEAACKAVEARLGEIR